MVRRRLLGLVPFVLAAGAVYTLLSVTAIAEPSTDPAETVQVAPESANSLGANAVGAAEAPVVAPDSDVATDTPLPQVATPVPEAVPPAEQAPAGEPVVQADPAAQTEAVVVSAESTGSAVANNKGNYLPNPTGAMNWVYRVISLVGIIGFVGIGWLISEKRGSVKWRPVVWGVGLQLLFGAVVLGLGLADYIYGPINAFVNILLGFSSEGAAFVFGSFVPHDIPFAGAEHATTYGLDRQAVKNWSPPLMNVAFFVLPTIIFFSSLMSLLYYLGVMTPLVKGLAWGMQKTLGTSGSESMSAAGNIFVGQTEAPLLVKPFVPTMTRSELMAVMTGGFATVAGGVLGVYVMLLQPTLPSIAGHLVVASIISAPAALAMAKLIVPETEVSDTAGGLKIKLEQTSTNFIEAAANGATDGMQLMLNVVAMLIAIVALVAMANWFIGWIPIQFCDGWGLRFGYGVMCAVPSGGELVAAAPLSMSHIFGVVFAPAAVLMGVPFDEVMVVGRLLGEKIVLTELLAYKSLAAAIASPTPVISQRAAIITSYALCGFANFASIGIQLGGIGGLAPDRMGELASLGFRAMIAGAIAACMTGAVAGVFL